ncbi:hypothetical protein BH10ACI3_BH10ACI3_28650 [soil metagenome]
MKRLFHLASLIGFGILCLPIGAMAQIDDICREGGEAPTREITRPGRRTPFIYGIVRLKGLSQNAKRPRVIAIFSDSLQPGLRQLIGESGNYCFKIQGTGAKLVIEVDGIEIVRKSISDMGIDRQREDFEIVQPQSDRAAPPGVISARFYRPLNDKTTDLYKKVGEAESNKHPDRAIAFVKEILNVDPDDFVAWAKLGSLYASSNSITDAEAAFKRALVIRRDYTPALLNLGLLKASQNQYQDAITLFERAVTSDPAAGRPYRLLGEAYLQARRGTDGLAALDEALRIDPVGMAECHLLKARLYDLAGAKALASAEYKAFLTKVPDPPEKKKFEQYIKDNP